MYKVDRPYVGSQPEEATPPLGPFPPEENFSTDQELLKVNSVILNWTYKIEFFLEKKRESERGI